MAVFHGKAGALSVAGTSVAQVTEWTLTMNKEMVETTALGDSARTYSAGLESFEGSCEVIVSNDDDTGFYDFAGAMKTGTAVAAIFYVDDSTGADFKYSGNVLVSSVEVAHVFDDIARMSISFTGNGAITVDTDDET